MGLFSPGSHTGSRETIAFPQRKRVADVRTVNGESALLAVSIQPVRNSEDLADPAAETEALALLEWGHFQGTALKAEVDIGRGIAFSLSASELRIDLANVGGGQAEAAPTGEFITTVSYGASRVVQPIRSLRFQGLAPGAVSSREFVPTFASRVTVHRTPEVAAELRFYNGAGGLFARRYFARDTTPTMPVPVGADRFELVNLDGGTLVRARVQFELAL